MPDDFDPGIQLTHYEAGAQDPGMRATLHPLLEAHKDKLAELGKTMSKSGSTHGNVAFALPQIKEWWVGCGRLLDLIGSVDEEEGSDEVEDGGHAEAVWQGMEVSNRLEQQIVLTTCGRRLPCTGSP